MNLAERLERGIHCGARATRRASKGIVRSAGRTQLEFRGLRVMHGGPRAMYLPEHSHVETQIQTCFRRTGDHGAMEPHRSSLYAPGQAHTGGIRDNWEVVVMLLEPQLMALAADELFSRDQFEIKPFSSLRSPLVEQLNEAALGELHSPQGPSLFYLESIGHAISGYLLRHHAVTSPLRVTSGTLSSG